MVSLGHKSNDKKILAIINSKTKSMEYVVEFVDSGNTMLIPMSNIDKYHTLKE